MDWSALLEKDPTGLLKKLTTKEKDPVVAHRKALLKNIDKARVAHTEGKKRGGIYSRVGDHAKVEVRIGRNPVRTVPINGQPFGLVPNERFPDFISGFKQHVESGGFDTALRGATAATATATSTRKPRGKMSPEALAARNRKRAATLAAKKAK